MKSALSIDKSVNIFFFQFESVFLAGDLSSNTSQYKLSEFLSTAERFCVNSVFHSLENFSVLFHVGCA